MTDIAHESSTPTIIAIGPPRTLLGGMVSVVDQICGLDLAGRYRLQLFETTVSPHGGESILCRAMRHARKLLQLRTTILRTRSPIIHIHTCSGFSFFRTILDMLVAQHLGRRVVLHIHGAAFDVFYANSGRGVRRFIAWSLARADRVVALSNGWRDTLRRMSPRARLVVVENAVKASQVVLTRSPNKQCRFLVLARMDDWKGIDDLLDACALLTATRTGLEVTLAGPPGSAGDAVVLQQKIENRHLQGFVRYVGPVKGESKVQLLRQANVYLQPSHHEGMPIALLEAIAHGLPVVATRVGAVPEVITDRREGLLIPARRPELLAMAMNELATDRNLRDDMSRAAAELAAKRFSLERLRDDLLTLYDGMLFADRGKEPLERPAYRGAPGNLQTV